MAREKADLTCSRAKRMLEAREALDGAESMGHDIARVKSYLSIF